jgi:hypothetical protein
MSQKTSRDCYGKQGRITSMRPFFFLKRFMLPAIESLGLAPSRRLRQRRCLALQKGQPQQLRPQLGAGLQGTELGGDLQQ